MPSFSSRRSPDLEQIGEVRAECDLDTDVLASIVVVPDGQSFVATAIPQEA
jgi:hypothetical protein